MFLQACIPTPNPSWYNRKSLSGELQNLKWAGYVQGVYPKSKASQEYNLLYPKDWNRKNTNIIASDWTMHNSFGDPMVLDIPVFNCYFKSSWGSWGLFHTCGRSTTVKHSKRFLAELLFALITLRISIVKTVVWGRWSIIDAPRKWNPCSVIFFSYCGLCTLSVPNRNWWQ